MTIKTAKKRGDDNQVQVEDEWTSDPAKADYAGMPSAKEHFETAKKFLASGDLRGALEAADMALSMNHLEGYKSARLVIGLQKQIKVAMRGDAG